MSNKKIYTKQKEDKLQQGNYVKIIIIIIIQLKFVIFISGFATKKKYIKFLIASLNLI